MRLLNSDEMKQVEQFTAKYGLSYQRMMENAGAACARNIRNEVEKSKLARHYAAVVCGKGNNGGDGFVIARKLAENGYNVCVIMAMGYPTSNESTYMYKMILDLGIPTVWYEGDKAKAIQTIKNADIVVDAIFGFSFYGNVSESIKYLLNEMSAAKGLKFAVDVPSGVYCDSGYNDPDCFKADYTIAISALKPAHIIKPAADCCGDIIIANIGIPEDSYQLVKDSLYTHNRVEVGNFFSPRPSTAHKGTFGHLLCICGSKNMVGAPVLASMAALRSGAGLVTVAFPENCYNTVSLKCTEALMMPLKETESGTISKDSIETILDSLHKYSAIVIGCGLSVNEDTRAVLSAVLSNAKVPVVVDADGINILSENIDLLQNISCDVILTPHPKEMSRLCGEKIELIESNRISYAKSFANEHGVYLVLKGANTIVSRPDSPKAYVNASGNSGLAKGGSGDVLAGIIGSFLAQGFATMNALTAAVYIHGYTADSLSDKISKTAMLPTDIIDELKYTMSVFEK